MLRISSRGGGEGGGGGDMRFVPMTTHLVQHLIKLAQLGDLLHNLLLHEERGVHGCETFGVQQPHGILDDGLLQKYCSTLYHVTHM